MLRVAALQFVVQPDTERNLTSCLDLIAKASRDHGANLLVLPEFANHSPVLGDPTRARSVAATLDGPFLTALAAACREHAVFLVVGVSLLDAERLTSTAILLSSDGSLLARADRHVLSDELASDFCKGEGQPEPVETTLGRLGLCIGRDIASMDATRTLVAAGAQLVCAPFGVESADDISLHVAARAAESRVFVVASGGGRSEAQWSAQVGDRTQIVAPDGTIQAIAQDPGDCLVVATLDVDDTSNKIRSDGTDILVLRRPQLYSPPTSRVRRDRAAAGDSLHIEVALLSSVDAGAVEGAIDSAASFVRELSAEGVQLVVLPELFCFAQGRVEDPSAAAAWFDTAVRRLAEACADTRTHVVTSLVEATATGYVHVGVVVGHAGVVGRAVQLHVPVRHAWATPGRRFEVLPLPWGKLGVLVGEDAILPEAARALSLLGAELLAAPLGHGEPWETRVGLSAAALENGVPVVAGLRETAEGGGLWASGSHLERASAQQPILRTSLRLCAREESPRFERAPSGYVDEANV